MEEHVSIKRTKTLPSGLDFDALRLRGISYVQELSGDIWTDYNEHDPGVTLLEHLCYALTDMAYRAGFDIKDILYADEGHGAATIDNGFFTPVSILPTTPITPTDYRRLLIDRVREIRNAWFDPIESHNRSYKGLFRIRIQLVKGIDHTLRTDEIIDKVSSLVMANRNLCEDLEEVIVLGTEYLTLSAAISIEADAFGEKVLASILHTTDQLLNPGIRYYSREELEAEGYTAEDIFDGPEPLHGFIKKEDLKPLPKSTYVSTIREAIAKVRGVKLIDNLVVWKNGLRIVGDEIIPAPKTSLSLDPKLVDGIGTKGSIRLHRNSVPVSINPRQTRQFLNTLSAKAKKGFQTKLNLNEPPVTSNKKKSDISAYRSFQRLMPAIYGLGQNGLPATANRTRRAQAYQLKAYLLVFEQFMADYLAQLAHVRDLFSIAPEGGEDSYFEGHAATYFTQFPADIPDVEHLYYHGLPKGTPHHEIIAAITTDLQRLSASMDPSDKRRNRFLDHLLARFGEVYNDDALRFMTDQSQDEVAETLVKGKASFLSKYPELSRNRSRAFDYTQEAWETENVSGLKKRVALLLNFSGDPENTSSSYLNRVLSPAKLLEGVSLRNTRGTSASGIELSLLKMLKEGIRTENYEVIKRGKKQVLFFRDKATRVAFFSGADAGANEGRKQGIQLFSGTFKQCLAARDRLIKRFQQINTTGEGFFFLENILLRPKKIPGSLLVFETQLPNGKGNVQLRSLSFTNEQSLYDLNTDILVIATHQTNWAIIAENKTWRVVLLKNGSPMMISGGFPSEAEANGVIGDMVNLFLKIKSQDPASINNYLRLEAERFSGFEVNAAFYSLRLSVIAPAWPALFQNQDFRQLFHQLVATNIPAHLSVDYYWLEPGEMTEFEDLFKDWLDAKRNSDAGTVQDLSLKLIRFLQPATAASYGIEPEDIHQKLPATLFKRLGDAFGYSFIFEPHDFSLIQGMPPSVAALMPELKIHDWKSLRKASPTALVSTIHEAGQPATRKQVQNWQKQATLAHNKRWSDLLRYQRRALKSGGQAFLSLTERTKVERVLVEALRTPTEALNGIRRWLGRLPERDFVPYPILNFLTEAMGYGFILPDNDLRIFSCIDEAHEKALNARGIYNWQHLASMKRRSWNSVIKELQSADEATEYTVLLKEAQLALARDWQALIDLQAPDVEGFPATTIEQRITHHLELLMAPANAGNRPLLNRLQGWRTEDKRFDVAQSTINRLIEVLDYEDLIPPNNFRIFEGIGKKTETELIKSGIKNWRQLGQSEPSTLRKALEQRLSAVVLRSVDGWVAQANLAAEGKWAELIEWQKGPVSPKIDPAATITAFEAGIKLWLGRNSRQEDNPTAS